MTQIAFIMDLSDTFLNNFDCEVQDTSDTNPQARVDSDKQDTTDGHICHFQKQN